MTHFTHCGLRLGDNLAALQLVRKLAENHPDREFVHACNLTYCPPAKLTPVIEDLPNIKLVDITEVDANSVDLWKGQNGYFYQHPKWREYVPFMLEFYALCSVRIGLPCPIMSVRDMLFDYPALLQPSRYNEKFDWLVVNSPPLSNQFRGYNAQAFEVMIAALCKRGKVVTTHPTEKEYGQFCAEECSVTEIGSMARNCKFILMVSTGPSWPTFNVWSENNVQLRVILLDNEKINLGRNTVHCNSVEAAHVMFAEKDFL